MSEYNIEDRSSNSLVAPSDSDAELCIEYRKQSKRGVRLHPDASAFCERMWQEFPVWYADQEYRVFNETVPFGSQVSRHNAKVRVKDEPRKCGNPESCGMFPADAAEQERLKGGHG